MSNFKVKIHNRFDVFKRNVITGEEKQIAQAENILLDRLWTHAIYQEQDGGNTGYACKIHVGTGTGALESTRTTMFSQTFAAVASGENYAYDEDTQVWSRRVSATISEVQHNGNTFREIGLGTINSILATHALLRDMNGNPVAIEKTDTDIITFYATTYAYIPTEADDGAIRIMPMLRSFLVNVLLGAKAGLLSYVNNPKANFVTTEDVPTRASDASIARLAVSKSITSAMLSKSADSKTIYIDVPRLAVGDGNVAGGIWGMILSWGIFFNFIRSSVYAGTYIEGESLGTGDGSTVDFKTAFPFVKAGAVVKVDGIEDVNATVDFDKPYNNDLSRHLKHIYLNDYSRSMIGEQDAVITIGSINICENPYWETYGIDYITGQYCEIYASEDMVDWTLINTYTSSPPVQKAVNALYRNYRYWKKVTTGTYSRTYGFLSDDLDAAELMNVHFVTPPALDAVITIDYTTSVIAKDINHVFNSEFSFTFDEHTEEY